MLGILDYFMGAAKVCRRIRQDECFLYDIVRKAIFLGFHRLESIIRAFNIGILMHMNGFLTSIKRCLLLCLYPFALHASFIESTQGTAVINDATAAYHNPAALTLLNNPQLIALESIASFHAHFSGQSIQSRTGFTQSGISSATTHYNLPSLYLAKPTTDKITAGLAVVANSFGRDLEQNSILRYDQSSNKIQGIDIVPAMGIKLNEYVSLGAALNLTYADFLLRPISGFPSLNIPDSPSRNDSKGNGAGGDVGLLLKPSKATTIGFNYRSAVTYRLHGKSVYEGQPEVMSNHYYFNFFTPARSVASINHFVTPTLGFIGTVQYIQWNIFKEINIHGIATPIGAQSGTVPYHLHNAWLFTIGGHYRITPKWIIRIASTYNQSPGNANYQIASGDSIILGGSMGYDINKNISIDGSYAHAFVQNQNINITGGRNWVNGVNRGSRDALSLKLTFTPS